MLMGDLLEEFFKRPYIAAKVAEGKLPDTWREIVGDRAAEVTTELRLENHILHVRIQSSVLRSELFYQREALREEINRRSGVPAGQRRNHPIKKCPSTEGHFFRIRAVRTYFTITARLAFWLFL